MAALLAGERHDGVIKTLDTPSGHLTLQFLASIAEAPRSYGDAMDAWRTS
jgi:hypothetical protein